MDYEERIARLRELGAVTQSQVERLVGGLSKKLQAMAAHRLPRYQNLAWVLVTVLLVLAPSVVAGEYPEMPEVQDVRTSLNQPEEIGDMGKSLTGGVSVALFIGIPLLALVIWITLLYNGLVSREEDVLKAWAQVESNYQRRADLIPNILETVSRYMRFEQKTLTDVVGKRTAAMAGRDESVSERDAAELRASVDDINKAHEASSTLMEGIKGAPQDEEQLEKLYVAQQALGASMHRILALAENYPVLRSADQMLTLQAELEGSENRINVARMRFNEAAAEFNASMRRMPSSLVASMGGFKRKAYFQADTVARKAVKVEFE